MKKYIFVIIQFIIFLQIFAIISLAETKPCLYVKDAIKYSNSEEVTVEIYMENVYSKIVTFGFDLKYDKSKV